MISIKSLRYSNFKKLFAAATTSEFGSFITETAIMLWLFSLVGQSKSWLGISRASFIFSYSIGSILGGSFKNYSNFRNILIFCELIRVPLVAILLFVENPIYIVIISSLIAFFQGIFTPLRNALTNVIVPKEDIKNANSLFSTSLAILHLSCPYLGALLFTLLRSIRPIVYFDIITYLTGAIFLIKMKLKSFSDKSFNNKKLSFDFSYIIKSPTIKTILINYFAIGLLVGILIPLLLPYTIEVLKKGEQEYGIIMFSFGLGGLIGGILSDKISTLIPSNN